ncbi:MAG TPA: methionyl-tRNA formyltransferase, partial [Coriobacteriia bacterium]|nr:methionyl-tRNA formyltransferase [Coriobacteriia bacterium]
MTAKQLRIVYMGTPDFAIAPLRALVEGGYNVVAVVTMPDKPSGRGQQIQESAVKKYALQAGLPLMQPEKLKDPQFVERFGALNADLGIVVAFRMLPEVIWSMPRLGTFNLHASLLPQYRGAAPINRAIMNGESRTGVTTFFLNAKMDEGSIIEQREVAILPEDNAGTLHDKLMNAGSALVPDTVNRIASGGLHLIRQNNIPAGELKPAPKIFKETCKIDFSHHGTDIVNLIRGLSPYPAAYAELCNDFSGADAARVEGVAGTEDAAVAGVAGVFGDSERMPVKIYAALFSAMAHELR